jgi:hypothetical protein
MTTLAGRWAWGPATGIAGTQTAVAGYTAYALDDLDDAVRTRFSVPKDGTLSKIGVHVHAVTGNPPAYQVIFKDLANNAYGGCAAQAIDFTVTGFQWVTLATPATAAAGDYVQAVLEPTGTAPDAANCISVRETFMITNGFTLPKSYDFTGAWNERGLFCLGVLYDDDSVALPGLSSAGADIDNATTPDEMGGLFTVPFACKCVGARISVDPAGTPSDFVVSLLSAADAVLATKTWDATYENAGGYYVFGWDEVSLALATSYRLTIAPNSGGNIGPTIAYCDAVASREWFSEGVRWQLTERTDAGAWTNTNTAVPIFALILSEITLPDAGGGGISAGGMIIG